VWGYVRHAEALCHRRWHLNSRVVEVLRCVFYLSVSCNVPAAKNKRIPTRRASPEAMSVMRDAWSCRQLNQGSRAPSCFPATTRKKALMRIPFRMHVDYRHAMCRRRRASAQFATAKISGMRGMRFFGIFILCKHGDASWMRNECRVLVKAMRGPQKFQRAECVPVLSPWPQCHHTMTIELRVQ
jgi:hypothetical protein